jgi:hypothetical protein
MSKNQTLFLALLVVLLSDYGFTEPLTFSLDVTEGGRLTPKAIRQFEHYMAKRQCKLNINKKKPRQYKNSDLHFSPLPLGQRQAKSMLLQYNQNLTISTFDKEPLTISILIRSNTRTENLPSLKGERITIISRDSYIGGSKAGELLSTLGIDINNETVYETGSYVGAFALLRHGDVFIAAIPGTVARLWGEKNDMVIIAESEPIKVGGIYFNESVNQSTRQSCSLAFQSLGIENRRDKKMNIFPAWVESFK